MRSYIGERDHGDPRVWVIDRPDRPAVDEVGGLLRDLPDVSDPARQAPGWAERNDAWMARKRDLLGRIKAFEDPVRRPLAHVRSDAPDRFEWGIDGDGRADLAHAILTDHLGVEPTDIVCRAFRDQVIAALPADRFSLPTSRVREWLAAHRDLVETELFLHPPAGDSPALSVTDPSPPLTVSDADDAPGGSVDDPAMASTLIAACEAAWRDIRTHHPELPEAVMVLGTGVERGRLVKLGHWWGGQWVADGQTRGEVLLAGEALHLEPKQVFEVLLHEAAHGINAARGVKDTSRGGRYHNQRFASTAREVMLRVRAMPPYGLAATALTPEALDRYGDTIGQLGDAMRIARQLQAGVRIGAEEGTGIEGTLGGGSGKDGAERGAKGGAPAATCGCGRRMRMAPSVLAAGPVLCGLCGSEFSTGAEHRHDATPEADRDAGTGIEPGGGSAAVVDRSFLARRQADLAAQSTPDRDPTIGVGDSVARVLQRQRARLEAALAAAPDPGDRVLRPLVERHDRLARLLSDAVQPRAAAPASPDQQIGVRELASSETVDADLDALRYWYERYGTLDEQPMPAADPAEAVRRERLARCLLKADGTLYGPAVTLPDGSELQAGDRVIPSSGDPGRNLPAETPGTVERVDLERGLVQIDFATWGRLRTSLDDALTRDLRHDYAEVRKDPLGLPVEVELARAGPGLEL